MSEEIKYYPTTPGQGVLLMAEALTGKTYNNLCIMVNFDQDDIDPAVLENAVNTSIIRFPSTSVRIHEFKEDKKKVVKQYFVDEPEGKCECLEFKSDKKMYKYINKLVRTKFPNNYNDCDLYKLRLIKRENGRYSVLVLFYHMIADAYAIIKFCEDFIKVYKALKNNTEMPKPFDPLLPAYENQWAYPTSKAHDNDLKFWNEFWSSITPPQFATINGFENKYAIPDQKYGNYLNIFNFKATQVNYRISADLNKRVETFAAENAFSPQIIYLLALKTWLSKKTNKTEEFVISLMLANRSKKCFANTGGSFAANISTYVDAKNSMPFIDACKQTSSEMYTYLKHCRLYETERTAGLKKCMNITKETAFSKGWVRGTSAFLFTYQPYFTTDGDDIKMSVERFTTGKSPMPIYITLMPTDNYTGEMNVNYEYMTKMHTEEDMAEFHRFLLKFLDKATANPETTLDELMNV